MKALCNIKSGVYHMLVPYLRRSLGLPGEPEERRHYVTQCNRWGLDQGEYVRGRFAGDRKFIGFMTGQGTIHLDDYVIQEPTDQYRLCGGCVASDRTPADLARINRGRQSMDPVDAMEIAQQDAIRHHERAKRKLKDEQRRRWEATRKHRADA